MDVIGYARLSAAREESTSIDRQHEIIVNFVKARGWTLTGIVDDPVASASKLRLNRPGLKQVREAIASGTAEAVVVWRLDRIARSVVDFGTLLDEGVSIISATEPLDTTSAMGRAMAEILQVFAAMEARATSARVTNSIDYLRRNDRFPGGLRPYGYRSSPAPDGAGKILEIDPAQATVIREAAERVLDGETLYSVVRDFNARGVPTARKANGWTHTALRGILIGDAVLGRVTARGALLRDEHGIPRQVWAPILTAEESARLRAILIASPTEEPAPRRRRAARLLSGLMVCGSCGSVLVVQLGNRRHTVYRCKAQTKGLACASATSINADRSEEEITSSFLKAVGRFQVVEEIVINPEPVGLAEVEESLQETARELTAPGADVPALVERLNALRARRDEIQKLPALPESSMIETGRTFAEEWEARDLLGRRRLLLGAIEHIEVAPSKVRQWDPSRLEIVWSS